MRASVLPSDVNNSWRRGSFPYKMAAFLRVLPTRWRRGIFAYKTAAMQNKQNVNKNNVEYITFAFSEGHVTASRSPGVTL